MEAPSVKEVKLTLSCFINNLPVAILMEILCTMPIKTLAACKSVCKTWLHLMRDPHFSQLHQARAPSEVCFQLIDDKNTIKLHMGNFNFLNNVEVKLNTLFEFPKFSVSRNNALNFDHKRGTLLFANYCNGLLCYYNQSRNRFALIWNPCTSELITFPAPKTHGVFQSCCGYGLGFSKKAKKFKLLRVIGSTSDGYVGEICTIEKTCSWKTVGPCSFDVPPWNRYRYGTFFQGTLHWAGSSDSTKSEIAIHTFDFKDDQFGRLPLPPYVQSRSSVGSLAQETLGVLGGCLFITEYTKQGVKIWLMKEYGVQDSWTNLYFLGYSLDLRFNYYCSQPITYMDNGEILMAVHFSNPDFFFYNPELKNFKVIGYGLSRLRVIGYRPSLVLLKDSMLGYDVHALKPRSADLKQGNPDWWKPVERQQH